MGLFGKSKKEREKEYMKRLDVPSCLKEDFELIIDDVFTIMGFGTVATGNISTGMCREGEKACVYKTNGDVLETIITIIDIHTKERKSNGYVHDLYQCVLSEHRSIFPPVSDPQVLCQFDGLLHMKLHQGKMPESDEMPYLYCDLCCMCGDVQKHSVLRYSPWDHRCFYGSGVYTASGS